MVQRIEVQLIDDIDPSKPAAETLSFGLDKTEYEIDLNEAHAKQLRAALSQYIEAGRRVGGRRKTSNRPASNGAGPKPSSASPAEIRAWARENGYQIPKQGRIPGDIARAYEASR